ncbi:MAG: hypothetical protein Q8P07_01535 [bacterium]|nr:hypothetical protein [bacterium]
MEERLTDILSVKQYSLGFLSRIYRDSEEISRLMTTRQGKRLLINVLPGYVIGEIFWQQSSRTFHSFASAGHRLGAQVVAERGVYNEEKKRWELLFSSETKDAWLEDEAKSWASCYDLLILRTPPDIEIRYLVDNLRDFGYQVPFINAGDGPREHATQTLIDGFALLQGLGLNFDSDHGKLKGRTVAFINDGNARVVKSLAWFLAKYFKMNLAFSSKPGLEVSQEFIAELRQECPDVDITESHELVRADAYYVVRNQTEYGVSQDCFSVTRQVADKYEVKAILHPFPRSKHGNELPIWLPNDPQTHSVSPDKDPRAMYLYQMKIAIPIRMALLKYLLNPDLDLKKLQEERLVREIRSQCVSCKRIEYQEVGWTENPPQCGYIQTIPHIFCPKCQPKK